MPITPVRGSKLHAGSHRFRHFFTSTSIPDAPQEIVASFDELQRIATSPEAAMRLWEMNAQVNATELAKKVRAPTLVLHCVGDRVSPIEEGRLMAKLIPGANFVELAGNNHVLVEGTPAFDQFFEETAAFLAMHNPDRVALRSVFQNPWGSNCQTNDFQNGSFPSICSGYQASDFHHED